MLKTFYVQTSVHKNKKYPAFFQKFNKVFDKMNFEEI